MAYKLTHLSIELNRTMKRTEYAKIWKLRFRELKKSRIVTEKEDSLCLSVDPEEKDEVIALLDSGLNVEYVMED